MYDIAIIGLGPAGATLARLLDPKYKIIAFDRKSGSEAGFRKPCGGLLAEDAQKALSKFDLALPKDILVDPQLFAVKTLDTKQGLMRCYQRFYINLDRHKFDMWLISLIPENVEMRLSATVNDIRRQAGGFAIDIVENGNKSSVSAKYIVGADGAHSIVRNRLFPEHKSRQYLAIQQWFLEEHSSPFYSCIFDRSITNSYCWSISKDGYFVLGGAFKKANCRQSFELLKQRAYQSGFNFADPVRTEACFVSIPRGLRDVFVGKDNAFLIGEAAGFISPSSLEGISYALNSGHILSDVFDQRHVNYSRAYKFKTWSIRLKLLLKYCKSPFMYNPLLRKLVMKSGLSAIKVIDNDKTR